MVRSEMGNTVHASPCEVCETGVVLDGGLLCGSCLEDFARKKRDLSVAPPSEKKRLAATIMARRLAVRDASIVGQRVRGYNLTPEQWQGFIDEQGGACAICGHKPDNPRSLLIDHNHDTGVVRGLLCTACNSGLGLFKDNVQLLDAASSYLEERGSYAGMIESGIK